jgi:ketosteroid isomerase-like protein
VALTRADVESWLASYEQAWRTSGTASLRELFTEDARYSPGPYRDDVVGLEAIAAFWEAERAGPDEVFTMASEIVAVDGQVAVARLEVHYGGPQPTEYRDLWIMRFADDGRCAEFEEWFFTPPSDAVG